MRILGLDVGEKTIGVAVCDPLGITAQGICTIRRKNIQVDLEELKKLVDTYNCDLIVMGLPKNMDGTIGASGERIIAFANRVSVNLELKVEMWDERLTTVAAHKAMLEADLSRNKRKKIVDKIAAVYILQGFLDRISNNKRRDSNG